MQNEAPVSTFAVNRTDRDSWLKPIQTSIPRLTLRVTPAFKESECLHGLPPGERQFVISDFDHERRGLPVCHPRKNLLCRCANRKQFVALKRNPLPEKLAPVFSQPLPLLLDVPLFPIRQKNSWVIVGSGSLASE
jgi:hypothetical protein